MSLDINYRDVLQILNMGGPHIGKLYLDNAFIDEDVIFKNVLYDVDKQNLYYKNAVIAKLNGWATFISL